MNNVAKLSILTDVLLHNTSQNLFMMYVPKEEKKERYIEVVQQTHKIEDLAIYLKIKPDKKECYCLFIFDVKEDKFICHSITVSGNDPAFKLPFDFEFNNFLNLLKSPNVSVIGASRIIDNYYPDICETILDDILYGS